MIASLSAASARTSSNVVVCIIAAAEAYRMGRDCETAGAYMPFADSGEGGATLSQRLRMKITQTVIKGQLRVSVPIVFRDIGVLISAWRIERANGRQIAVKKPYGIRL